jgi:hypothetical protein
VSGNATVVASRWSIQETSETYRQSIPSIPPLTAAGVSQLSDRRQVGRPAATAAARRGGVRDSPATEQDRSRLRIRPSSESESQPERRRERKREREGSEGLLNKKVAGGGGNGRMMIERHSHDSRVRLCMCAVCHSLFKGRTTRSLLAPTTANARLNETRSGGKRKV